MTISRRQFVKAGTFAAALCAARAKTVLGQSWKDRDGNPMETPPQNDPLANYSKAAFVSYLNSVFQIQTTSRPVVATLTKVDDLPTPPGGEAFSLLFVGGSSTLPQDTYIMVHPALGTFELFLVPAGSDQNGARRYRATINRISPTDFTNMTAPARTTTRPNNK